MGLILTSPPDEEPITLEEAKSWLKLEINDDDDAVTALIVKARQFVENSTGRQLGTATWTLLLNGFHDPRYSDCGTIYLPNAPCQGVNAITYFDGSNDVQEWDEDSYDVDFTSEPARVKPAYGQSYPQTFPRYNAVNIEFDAGYEEVPQAIKQAMLLLIGHWYENREASTVGTITTETPLGVRALLSQYWTGNIF